MALTLTNSLSKISHCDKECSNVTDNRFKRALFEKLESTYQINPVSNSIYKKLDSNKIKNISFHPHIISPWSNGNPYMMYLTQIDGINCCFYIDRKKNEKYYFPKILCVKYRFDPILFEKETIMTGELIRDEERRWFFLIDNILVYQGKKLSDKNIISRFELIHKILEEQFTPDPYIEICPIQVKKLFSYKEIKTMVNEFIPSLSYICKGIIFYTLNNQFDNYAFEIPRDSGYQQFTILSRDKVNEIVKSKYPDLFDYIQNNIVKPSPSIQTHNYSSLTSDISYYQANNNSESPGNLIINLSNGDLNIDEPEELEDKLETAADTYQNITDKKYAVFKVLKTDRPDIYNLYYFERRQPKFHSIALIPNIKTSKMMNEIFNDNKLNINMRFRYSQFFDRWVPMEITNEQPMTLPIITKIIEQQQSKS